VHPQDKSEGDSRPYWHHKPARRPSHEEEQAWVLDHLLGEFPALMTYDETRVDRVRDREDWSESDSFEIAVRALFAGGLIRRQGDLLVPVRPVRLMADLGFELG
jgi:hypothetical protein